MEEKEEAIISVYKLYLIKPETVQICDMFSTSEDGDYKAFVIEAMNWHFAELSTQIVEEALPKTMLTKLDKEYKEIKAKSAEMKGKDGTKKSLCYHYNFVTKIAGIMDKFAEDITSWMDFVDIKRIGQLIIMSDPLGDFEVPTTKWLDTLCNSMVNCERIVEELINSAGHKLSIIHAQNVARAIRKSAKFRHFLCGIDMSMMKQIVKPKIEKIVGNLEMMRLVEEFPEPLRIDLISMSTMLECYQHIFSLNFPKHNSEFLRFTMAMMIGIVRKNEKHFKKQLTAKNENLQKIFEKKVAEILDNAYANLYSAKTICVMIKFMQFAQQSEQGKHMETELKQWKTKECEKEEQQQNTLDEYMTKELGKQYRDGIVALLTEGGNRKRRKMLHILSQKSAKTKLIQMVGIEQFNEMEIKCDLQEIFPSNSFLNDDFLWKHYETTLLTNNFNLKMRNNMQADLIVFSRFLHHQLMVEQNMPILWGQMNKFFELKYDSMFVVLENDHQMETMKILSTIFVESKKFMENEIRKNDKILGENSKNEQEMLGNKWQKAIDLKWEKNLAKLKKWDKFIKKLHQTEIITLMGRHKHIMQKLGKDQFAEFNPRLAIFVNIREFSKECEQFLDRRIDQNGKETNGNGQIGKMNDGKKLMENEKKKGIEKEGQKGKQTEEEKEIHSFGSPDEKAQTDEMPQIEEGNAIFNDRIFVMEYIQFFHLENNEVISKKNGQCLPIELSAILWILTNFLKQIKADIQKVLLPASRTVQICLAYYTIEYIIRKIESANESSNLNEWRKAFFIQEFIDKDDNSFSPHSVDIVQWLKQKCVDNTVRAQYVVSRLCSEVTKMEQINFSAFHAFLKVSPQLRGHFSKMKMPTEQEGFIKGKAIESAKNKLYQIVGIQYLVQLENEFPEELQIESQLLENYCYFYVKLLKYKSHTDQARACQSRIAIPSLIEQINNYLAQKRKMPTISAELKEAYATKGREILTEAYKWLPNSDKFNGENGIGRTLCILMAFLESIKTGVKEDKKSCNGKSKNLEWIRKWRPKMNCAEKEAQLNALKVQQTEAVYFHFQCLTSLISKNKAFAHFVRKTPGAKVRMSKLIEDQKVNQKILEISTPFSQNKEVFTDLWLVDSYLECLYNFEIWDAETKLTQTLALSYGAWVRWMDAETAPENTRLSIGMKQIYEQIWSKKRAFYQQIKYDELFDQDMDELRFELEIVGEVFDELRHFVEAKRNERNLKQLGVNLKKRNVKRLNINGDEKDKLMEQWEEIWAKINGRKKIERKRGANSREDKVELTEWMHTLHFNALNALLEKNKTLRDHFRIELEFQQENLEKWLIHFMGWELAEKVIDSLKLTEEQFAIMREYEKKVPKEEPILAEKEEKKDEKEEKWKFEKELEKWEEMEKKEGKKREGQKEKKEKKKTEKEKKEKKMRNLMNKKKEKLGEENGTTTDEKSEEKGTEMAESSPLSSILSEKEKMVEKVANEKRNGQSESEEQRKSNNLDKNEQSNKSTAEQKEDEQMEKAMEMVNIRDFVRDDFLTEKYEEYLLEPNEVDGKMLGIGIYFNEIAKRFAFWEGMMLMKAISKFEKHEIVDNGANEIDKLKQKWINFLQNYAKNGKNANLKAEDLKEFLHNLLKEIYLTTEGRKFETEKIIENNAKNKRQIIGQMHKNNLANLIGKDIGQMAEIWDKLEEERRTHLLALLCGKKEDNAKKTKSSNLAHQFKMHLEKWRKMLEQKRIDLISTMQHRKYLLNRHLISAEKAAESVLSSQLMASEINQQIFFDGIDDETHLIELPKILEENDFVSTEKPNNALNELKSVVFNWYEGDAILFETGSIMLGANTSNSDVDVICAVSEKASKEEEMQKFFGTLKCDLAQRNCADASFYCHLCQNDKVELLKKMPFAYVPLIEMTFDGIQFDILFVSIPPSDVLPAKGPMTRNKVTALMRKLTKDEKMVKSLDGFIANDRLMALLGRKNMPKFRKFLTILKLWAKSNYVNKALFGFFNGISLAIMATKIMLLYPNASTTFLLDKFFLTFVIWDWPVPIRLAEYVPNEFDQFSWTPKDEEEKKNSPLFMPILTPGTLEQNGMYNMNSSTFKIVQKTMREGLVKIRQIQNSSPTNWSQLFPTAKFTEKYDHFFAVCCIVGNHIHLELFCDFVERRMRLQLLHFDQLMTAQINFSHLKIENGPPFECPNSILAPNENRHLELHKAWLVGIELEKKTTTNDAQMEHIKRQINSKLHEQFDKKLLENYLNGCFQPVKLVSKYVDKSELIHG